MDGASDETQACRDAIRERFSQALSRMYRAEVPAYGVLLDCVQEANAQVLGEAAQPAPERLAVERHGAIRLGTVQELRIIRRLFAAMGMSPVGYYDLSVAGLPVHATAFRPLGEASLARNPLRIFTSLLRLDLVADPALRRRAGELLAGRRIASERCLALIRAFETQGGLDVGDQLVLVQEALAIFRWNPRATVDAPTYDAFRVAHPLLADVVCFGGPHINHLTPGVLDIDRVQRAMRERGLAAKATIEGPPRRELPVLLRQTSFLAQPEPIHFVDGTSGTHTARFGEVEQRGCALSRRGRALYDQLLLAARAPARGRPASGTPAEQDAALRRHFEFFPDSLAQAHHQGLACVRYHVVEEKLRQGHRPAAQATVPQLLQQGWLRIAPLVYEDFLPVSAAGIFRSNLGEQALGETMAQPQRALFEEALGAMVADECQLYEQAEARSLADCLARLA